jgi:hypothetical protein
MIYGILAEFIVAIHLAYVSFVVVGLLLILVGILRRWQWIRNPWFRCIHLLMILIVAVEAMGDVSCPLTTWEYDLRALAGQEPSTDTFVGRMLRPVLFAASGTTFLPTAYYVFAGLIVATFFIAPPRFRKVSSAPTAPIKTESPVQS